VELEVAERFQVFRAAKSGIADDRGFEVEEAVGFIWVTIRVFIDKYRY
jgi:hypothetical protein